MRFNFGFIPGKKTLCNILFGWPKLIRKIQASHIWKQLQITPDDRFLDIGCGRANFTTEVARVTRSVGVDISFFNDVLQAKKLQSNLFLVAADAVFLPFKKESFTKILLGGTLQSVTNDSAVIEETFRVLEKDGTAVISVLVGHSGVKLFYDMEKKYPKINQFLIELARIPKTFPEFEESYQKQLGLTRYYSIPELRKLVARAGFEVREVHFSPNKIESILFDWLLMIAVRMRLPLPNHPMYVIFYPLFLFIEKITGSNTASGNEMLCIVQKK
ncbi:class I SAM-dependent methyltransferase [Chlamydiota bacterium]